MPGPAHEEAWAIRAYLGLKRYAEAVEAYKEAIRLEPDNASAHMGLGGAYRGLDRDAEAVEAFKEAIRLEPDNASAHLAWAGHISGWTATPRRWKPTKRPSAWSRTMPGRTCGLGLAYRGLERDAEAVEAYKEAIRLEPDVDASAHRAWARHIAGWAATPRRWKPSKRPSA
jgi:cytochrome c-type biogenesis protein CcmH/NrfG